MATVPMSSTTGELSARTRTPLVVTEDLAVGNTLLLCGFIGEALHLPDMLEGLRQQVVEAGGAFLVHAAVFAGEAAEFADGHDRDRDDDKREQREFGILHEHGSEADDGSAIAQAAAEDLVTAYLRRWRSDTKRLVGFRWDSGQRSRGTGAGCWRTSPPASGDEVLADGFHEIPPGSSWRCP